MNIKQRALAQTILTVVALIVASTVINLAIQMMTPTQLGIAFFICVTALFTKIIYDYRLAHLEYKAKLEEITQK